MRYISTRGRTEPLSFREAVAVGLAPDGGLLVPEKLPDISPLLPGWRNLSYEELTTRFVSLFCDEPEAAALRDLARRSYQGFSEARVAPLRQLDESLYVLELFHGPSLAFKDFGLQFLGNLYEAQIARTGRPINVLGATSGDTGAAAIQGLLGKRGVCIFILYPDGRISELQERQMACTGAANVYPLAIEGSFDDAQRLLKETLADLEFGERYNLSTVNSINLARIVAQCVYYVYAWFQLGEESGGEVTFAVPTGNFGNVLAGWMAQKMGLPVRGFKISTNQNDILYHLFRTGVYEVRDVTPSVAPSMDIQVASNFERFIYYQQGESPSRVEKIMGEFLRCGRYRFENFNRDTFTASRADDGEVLKLLREVYEDYGYLVDPHTACGFKDLDGSRTNIVLATAHPAKFPETMFEAVGREPQTDSLEKLKGREVVKYRLPARKEAIEKFIGLRGVANR